MTGATVKDEGWHSGCSVLTFENIGCPTTGLWGVARHILMRIICTQLVKLS